jgi:hypothetical protein
MLIHQRYKMPVMTIKIEGRGNGIKTVLPNVEDVARALARPPTCASYSLQSYEAKLTCRPNQVFRMRARCTNYHG